MNYLNNANISNNYNLLQIKEKDFIKKYKPTLNKS